MKLNTGELVQQLRAAGGQVSLEAASQLEQFHLVACLARDAASKPEGSNHRRQLFAKAHARLAALAGIERP